MVKKILTFALSITMTGSIITSINIKEHNSSKNLVPSSSYITTLCDTIDPDADDID